MSSIIQKEHITHGNNDFNFAFYEHFNNPFNIQIHWHQEYEIVYVLNGACEFLIDGKIYTAKKGEAILIDSFSTHSSYKVENCKSENDFVCFLFGERFLFPSFHSFIYKNIFSSLKNKNSSITQVFNQNTDSGKEILNHINSINNLYKDSEENALSLQIEFLSIFNVILKNKLLIPTSNKFVSNNELIQTALNSIHNHYLDDISIQTLASSLHISVDYFITLFKKHVGITPKKYVLNMRLDTAKKLLLSSSNLSITQISESCGFSDFNYFCRIFKKNFAISPLAFRNSERKINKKFLN